MTWIGALVMLGAGAARPETLCPEHAAKGGAVAAAAAELAALVARERMGGEFCLGPFWPGQAGPTAEVRLVLGADAADPLADPAYLVADRLVVAAGEPRRFTAADPGQLRAALARSADAAAALALARAQLKTESRYAGWKREGWRYRTVVYPPQAKQPQGQWTVSVDPTNGVTDQDLAIVVDVAARKVVRVMRGVA